MRRLIVLLCLFLICKVSAGSTAGNVSKLSPEFIETQNQIDQLNKKAFDIYLKSPDSARRLSEKALLLAQKINYAYGKGRSFYNIGLVYWLQSYYNISLFYFNSAINYFPPGKALEISDCYNGIGRDYADLGNYEQARISLDKSVEFAGENQGRQAEAYSEIAYLYCKMGDYDKSIAAARYALKLNQEINAEGNVAVGHARLASIYKTENNYLQALYYDSIAYAMSLKIHNNRLKAKIDIEKALIYNALGKYDSAIVYAKSGAKLADSIGVYDAETEGYSALVASYEAKNDLKQALLWQKKYAQKRDSIAAAAKMKSIELLQGYYSLNSKLDSIRQMEINDRESREKIQAQNKLIFVLSIAIAFLIIVAFVCFYLYKQKKQLSTRLENQNDALLNQKQLIEVQTVNLQSVNDLKDKLLAVIGHDLRTPVANMSNIIEMFNDGYLTADEVSALMHEISPVVKGAELTLSNLTEWAGSQIKGRSKHATNIDVFLLGVEMEQTFAHHLQLKGIEFANKAFAGQCVAADENHIKVILRNLISNAIKFTSEKGRISLSTWMETDQLVISVSDTGKGMTQDEIDKLFSIDTHFSHSGTSGEKGTGIGLLLCKELVELNGGKLSVSSVLDVGSTFSFNLPLTFSDKKPEVRGQ